MTSTSPRPARTRAAIVAAYAALLHAGRDADLTVAGVAAEAGVSRSSFYQHYATLDAVAADLIGQLFHDVAAHESVLRAGAARDGRALARESLSILCHHIDENPDLYLGLIRDPDADAVRSTFVRTITATTREAVVVARPDFTERQAETAAKVIAGGFAYGVVDWLESAPRAPVEELIELLLDLLPPWHVLQADPKG